MVCLGSCTGFVDCYCCLGSCPWVSPGSDQRVSFKNENIEFQIGPSAEITFDPITEQRSFEEKLAGRRLLNQIARDQKRTN